MKRVQAHNPSRESALISADCLPPLPKFRTFVSRRSSLCEAPRVVMQLSGHEQQMLGTGRRMDICALRRVDRGAKCFTGGGVRWVGAWVYCIAIVSMLASCWLGAGRLHLGWASRTGMHQPCARLCPLTQLNQSSVVRRDWHSCC